MTIGWESAGATHTGRVRKANEDSYRIDETNGVFIVADGMGGHAAGEVASALAADAVLERLTTPGSRDDPERAIVDAFDVARRRLVGCCESDPRTEGMGTTLTVALVGRDGTLRVGHLGDSRLYRCRAGNLELLTRDHTWVQQEVDAGRLTPDAARNHRYAHVLTRVLAAEDYTDPDVLSSTVRAGDTLLLCSDGLHGLVEEDTILEIVAAGGPPAAIVERLVGLANDRGGTDNVTTVAVAIR